MKLAYNITLVDEIRGEWQQLVDANEPLKALALLDQLIAEYAQASAPGISWLYCLKGKTCLILGHPRHAVTCYIRCLKIRRTSYVACAGLTEALTRLGKNTWANACRASISRRMHEGALLLVKWQDFLKVGDYDSARSIISDLRWNVVEFEEVEGSLGKRNEWLQRLERIIWNDIEYTFGEAEAHIIFLILQE